MSTGYYLPNQNLVNRVSASPSNGQCPIRSIGRRVIIVTAVPQRRPVSTLMNLNPPATGHCRPRRKIDELSSCAFCRRAARNCEPTLDGSREGAPETLYSLTLTLRHMRAHHRSFLPDACQGHKVRRKTRRGDEPPQQRHTEHALSSLSRRRRLTQSAKHWLAPHLRFVHGSSDRGHPGKARIAAS